MGRVRQAVTHMNAPPHPQGGVKSQNSLVVATRSGRVRGVRGTHGRVFFGVPYAAAPLGALRFATPQPHPDWEEIRDATRPGPNAPQPPRSRLGQLDLSPFFGTGWQPGDDYLTLNLWAPVATTTLAPVLVFVHGGAFLAGSTHGPVYDGTAFARDGIVVVTLNYRLGVPGFLHLPGAPDNRGRLDVVAALEWVQGNIAGFGGDPGNVTLSGQSAGAIIVTSIVAAPGCSHLFARAIIESGSGLAAFSSDQAGIVTAALGRELGVAPTVARLSPISDEQFVDLIPRLTALDLTTKTAHHPLAGITPFSLVLDEQPADQVARFPSMVDLLIGSNSEESSLYLAPFVDLAHSTMADVHDVAARLHPEPDRLVETYRATRPSASAAELRVAMLGDGMFGVGTRRFADAHAASGGESSTFLYEFTWRSDALAGQLGCCHLMELPFVFDRLDLPALHGPQGLLGSTPPPPELPAEVHAAWVRFVSTGDPGWPAYSGPGPIVQEIGTTWRAHSVANANPYSAWSRGLPAQ